MSKQATKPRSVIKTRSAKRTSKKTAKKAAAKRAGSKGVKKATKTAAKKTAGKTAKPRRAAAKSSSKAAQPVLLSGGNPQIAKGYGDAPVQAYIAAMPGWKRDVGRALDDLIMRTVPHVHKAVKWNSPFYGIEGQGWFISLHCFTHFVRVAFFRGAALHPIPPGASKIKFVRYLDIREDDELDETQLKAWAKQASELPGAMM